MIDPETGTLTLSATCRIRAGDRFEALFTLLPGEEKSVADHQNGWQWLTVRNVELDGYYYVISLSFYCHALKQIALVVAKDRFDLRTSWDNWSEQAERDALTALRRWLIRELGREGTFSWGEAQATYDPRSGSSSINIRYY